MNDTNIIIAALGGGRTTVTASRFMEDYGQVLKITGVELPDVYQVDFSNSLFRGTSKTMLGNADGVAIPDEYISTGRDVYAFLYLTGDMWGRTIATIRIPNKTRPTRTDAIPTPTQQSVIDATIAALNDAVESTAADAEQTASDAARAEAARTAAETAEANAEASATAAAQSEANASASASQASQSATASAQSASQSAQIKTDIEGYVSTAQTAAQTATNKASAASQSATNASTSATTATTKAGEASASATTASNKASEASGYASTASQKATESAQSASQALSYKTDAESAKTASQTAQGLAETARNEAVTAKTDAESARDEAQEIVDGITGKVEQIDSNTNRIESLEDDRYKPYAVDSASGSIASFPDGADDIPLKSCIVQIEPVQDLHGYDNPWPAGGGKQLLNPSDFSGFPQTINGITANLNADGSLTLNGTASDTAYISIISYQVLSDYGFFEPDVSYTLSGYANEAAVGFGVYGSGTDYWSTDASGKTMQFTSEQISSLLYRLLIRVVNGTTCSNVVVKPMICKTSATNPAQFAPYSNVCPISGWTGAKVSRTGKNLSSVNELADQGPQWGDDQSPIKAMINTLPVGTYTLSNKYEILEMPSSGKVEHGAIYVTAMINGKQQPVNRYTTVLDNSPYLGKVYEEQAVITITEKNKGKINHTYTYCDQNPSHTGSGRGKYRVFDIQIELGSTATDYEPYQGNTYDITFPSEAGTVYGGTLDVTKGELVVDRAQIASYNGEALPSTWISDRDVYASGTTPTIGAQVVYKLASPITYHLTPTEVQSILGQNHVWADCGDVEAEYRADTKLYIQRLTQPDTADMIADANITSGQYFMVGNSLYKATANIASGATISPNVNCTRKSLSEALNELNA